MRRKLSGQVDGYKLDQVLCASQGVSQANLVPPVVVLTVILEIPKFRGQDQAMSKTPTFPLAGVWGLLHVRQKLLQVVSQGRQDVGWVPWGQPPS